MNTASILLLLLSIPLCNGTDTRNNNADIRSLSSLKNLSGERHVLKEDRMKAIYLFEEVDLDSFFMDCKAWGINMVFTNSIYWENREFIDKAKTENIRIGLLFPVFFNPGYLESHPEDYCITSSGNKAIKDWLHFGCPSSDSFYTYQKEYLERILPLLNPELVVFDFIRFYVHWERVSKNASFDEIEDGCYCDRCLNDFQDFSNIQLQERTAHWIKRNALTEWTDWKCSVIEDKVEDLVRITSEYRRSLPKGVKTVPWSQAQYDNGIRSIAGQDLNRLKKHVDFFLPMTYSHLLDQDPDWIEKLVNETNTITGKKVYSTVQMEKVFGEQANITDSLFTQMLGYGFKGVSQGIVLFYYKKGSDNHSKGKLVNAMH